MKEKIACRELPFQHAFSANDGGVGQNPQCSFHENNMSSSRQYKSLSQSVSSSCFSITLIFFVSLASVSLLRECGRWKFNRERLTESE